VIDAVIEAVLFDLDGVLVDSEQLWDAARHELVTETGRRWVPGATETMMGMSSTEWSAYLHDHLGVPLRPQAIAEKVAEMLLARYGKGVPLFPGAAAAVRRMAARWPLALASSSNRSVIDVVLVRAGLDGLFGATVSSEEVERGKPAPDVYLEAAHRLGVDPRTCAVVEDSTNGIKSGAAAAMTVVAIPNLRYPPEPEALALATVVLPAIDRLSPETLA
jgi:HAD superfamily hydrolase (TIGR01509 family)